jgi:F-type H+-transporting ATPase subunit b
MADQTDAARELNTVVETDGTQAATPSAYPKALGLDATMWVAVAMLVVIALALWKKVPAMVGAMLDKRIAEIRRSLDEAAQLRAEAEALKAEYEAKAAAADKDAAAMREAARHEAEALLAKAEIDARELVARRAAMAEDKIAAAERAAVAEVRAKAANAAATAAAISFAANHDSATDKALIDRAIATLN